MTLFAISYALNALREGAAALPGIRLLRFLRQAELRQDAADVLRDQILDGFRLEMIKRGNGDA